MSDTDNMSEGISSCQGNTEQRDSGTQYGSATGSNNKKLFNNYSIKEVTDEYSSSITRYLKDNIFSPFPCEKAKYDVHIREVKTKDFLEKWLFDIYKYFTYCGYEDKFDFSNTTLFDGINSDQVAWWQDVYERVVSLPENPEWLEAHREKFREDYADIPTIAMDYIHKKYNPYLLEHRGKFFEVNPRYKVKGLIKTLTDLVEAFKKCNLPHLDTILADKVYRHIMIYHGFDSIHPISKPPTNQTTEIILELKKELRFSKMTKQKRTLENTDRRIDDRNKSFKQRDKFWD